MLIKSLSKISFLTLGAMLALTACQASPAEESKSVNVLVHGSFDVADFEELASAATGYDVTLVTGSAGQELSTTIALTAGAPLADAFFGIDNIFASRTVENGAVEAYKPANLGERATAYLYDADASMVPVTISATCLNVDSAWFTKNGIEAPKSYEDLLREDLKGLTVLIDPTSSTTGASFLVGTIERFGEEGAFEYWEELAANGARFADGWSEAYYSHFTGGSADGTKPIVVSYSSSPAYTVAEGESVSSTLSLNDTCSSLVEYAGVLKGAPNPAGARAVVDYFSSKEFQDLVADSMYVYPIDEGAYVPKEWEDYAPFPENLRDIDANVVGEMRDTWLSVLADRVGL